MVKVKRIVVLEIDIVIENNIFDSLFYGISGVLGMGQEFPIQKYKMWLTDRLTREMVGNRKLVIFW